MESNLVPARDRTVSLPGVSTRLELVLDHGLADAAAVFTLAGEALGDDALLLPRLEHDLVAVAVEDVDRMAQALEVALLRVLDSLERVVVGRREEDAVPADALVLENVAPGMALGRIRPGAAKTSRVSISA